MPHFDHDGHDLALCQICCRSVREAEWRTDITGCKSAGNVCRDCLAQHERTKLVGDSLRAAVKPQRPMSLHEHCRRESGLTGAALDRYINRYYGHN